MGQQVVGMTTVRMTHGCQDKEGERDAQSVCRNVHEPVRSATALGMDRVAEVQAVCKVR
jgi:hypothetical protein